MMDWQGKWLRECKTIEDVKEAVGKKQFFKQFTQREMTVGSGEKAKELC